MSKFEAHITLHVNDEKMGRHVATLFGWKTSQITGDPMLDIAAGPKPWFYLTRYDADGQALLNNMRRVDAYFRERAVEPVRLKLEEIIFDTRTGLNARGW